MTTQSSDHTYASARAAAIPAAVGILQLQDRGHSFWRRSASEPAHEGKFQSGDGAWWELMRDQTVTPFMFGAIGDGGATDDTAALQNFFDFCDMARVGEANWEGRFGVTASLYLGGRVQGPSTSPQEHAIFTGEMSLLVKNNIAGAVLYNRTRANAVFDRLSITPYVEPGLAYQSKLFDFGILFDSHAQQQTWANITVGYARIWGVFIQTYGNMRLKRPAEPGYVPTDGEITIAKRRDNTFSNSILNSFFYGCGSGSEFADGAYAANHLSAAFVVESRNDDWGSFGQYSWLSLTAAAPHPSPMPPPIINNDILGTGYETAVYVRINDQHYRVVEMDYANSRIKVFPALPAPPPPPAPPANQSGTVYFIFGGGFGSVGGDAGITSVKGAASVCATGYWNGAQYPGYFDVTVQHNAFGYVVGPWYSAVALGGSGRVYFEGNDVDLLWEATSGTNAEHTILSQTAINPKKIKWWAPRLANGALAVTPRPRSVQIAYRGRWLHTTADQNDPGTGNFYLGSARFSNPPEITSLRGPGAFTIQIEEFSPDHESQEADNSTFRDKFGFRAQYFLCTGSNSANGAPAGGIVVQRVRDRKTGAAYGKLNNGETDVTLSAPFTGPVLVCVEQATTGADDYFAYVVAGQGGSATLANDSVGAAHLANMPQNTIKGRANGMGTGDPMDLSPAQARAVIASDSNNGSLFLAGDGTFKAPSAGGGWTVDYIPNRAGYYNEAPPNMTHVIFNTSNDNLHRVYLRNNVANGTRVKLSRFSGGHEVMVVTADYGQTLSRRLGTSHNPKIADGGTVFLTKIGTDLWMGEGDFLS